MKKSSQSLKIPLNYQYLSLWKLCLKASSGKTLFHILHSILVDLLFLEQSFSLAWFLTKMPKEGSMKLQFAKIESVQGCMRVLTVLLPVLIPVNQVDFHCLSKVVTTSLRIHEQVLCCLIFHPLDLHSLIDFGQILLLVLLFIILAPGSPIISIDLEYTLCNNPRLQVGFPRLGRLA